MNKKLSHYFYFVYYTNKFQILYRIFSKFKKRVSFKLSNKNIVIKKLNYIDNVRTVDFGFDVTQLINYKFVFLNTERVYHENLVWNDTENSMLWNFHLNYFDYLANLITDHKKNNNDYILEWGLEVIHNWMNSSSKYDEVMWSPYTTSLRIVNWIDFIIYLRSLKSHYETTKIEESIFKQYKYLKSNLEYDIKGNHLLENLKALTLCSIVFQEIKTFNKYLKILVKQLDKQVLSDGCHYEKSISYHIVMLEGLINTLEWIKQSGFDKISKIENTSFLYHQVERMHRFYDKIKYNHETYPLFNDSNYSMTSHIKNINNRWLKIKDYFGTQTSNKSKSISGNLDSGYYIYNKSGIRLTMDLGSLGPHELLAHAHNDIFNFELVVNGINIINDSGVTEYENGPWRRFSRSTKAHNTVMINNVEQSDIWSSFRIGWRPKFVKSKQSSTNNNEVFNGEYKGKKYIHNRTFKVHSKRKTVTVIDDIKTKNNSISKSYLHFNPDLQLKSNQEIITASYNDSDLVKIKLFNYDKYNIYLGHSNPIQGWVMNKFGKKQKRNTLEIISKNSVKTNFGYVIDILHNESSKGA